MKTSALFGTLTLATVARAYTLYSDTTATNLNASLASFAPHGLYIGAAINPQSETDPVTDAALIKRKDYNMFVAENECKYFVYVRV